MKRTTSLLLCLLLVFAAPAQTLLQHPWQGKRVAYLGDSITDPRNGSAKKKFWGYLQEWLQIEPLVYGISGRQWDDIPNQANRLRQEHGDEFDAIIIQNGKKIIRR